MRRSLLKLLGVAPMLGPSGDGLAAPVNAPPGVRPSPGVQPGISQVVIVANRVIVFGPSGQIVGVFVYSGKPAAGNLTASLTALDGVDQFGNHYWKNHATYTGNGVLDLFTALTQAGINWGTNQNGPGGTGHLRFNVPTGTTQDQITTWDPVAGFPTAETWHTITPFLNGWAAAAGVQAPQYRLGVEGQVWLRGSLDGSAANAATFATMPAAYRPPSATQFFGSGANGGVPAGQAPFGQVATTGSIAILGFTPGTAGAHATLTGSYPIN